MQFEASAQNEWSMFGDSSRRRFIKGTAVAALATLRGTPGWAQGIADLGSGTSGWVPGGELLRNIPRLLELSTVPGVAVGVVDNGAAWTRGFGRASLDPGRAIERATVFEAASLGKPLCALAALSLVDRGALELDRPVRKYFNFGEGGDDRLKRITLRHILSHTTGLPNWRKAPGPLVPATEPGQSFSYSGEGFMLLQRLLEEVTDQPFPHLMRDRVLEPLGMDSSSFVWGPGFEGRMATGYDAQGEPLEVMAPIGRRTEAIAAEWHRPVLDWRYADAARAVPLINSAWPTLPIYMVPNAAYSFLTTVEDYLAFLGRLVAGGRGPGLGLKPATLAAMTTSQVALNRELSWGLGWGLEEDGDHQVLWHWGASNSFRNFTLADPANGRAVVVFTNSENGPRVYERVIASITGRDHAAFLWI